MFEHWEIAPDEAATLIQHLKNLPHLNQTNRNLTIVEVGRFFGNFTKQLIETWPDSMVFSIDSGLQLAEKDPLGYANSMAELARHNITAIQSPSPPMWAWPKAWAYDLFVLDIGSDFAMIRQNLRWWAHSARFYRDGTRGAMLVNLPRSTESREYNKDMLLAEENMVATPITKSWFLANYY